MGDPKKLGLMGSFTAMALVKRTGAEKLAPLNPDYTIFGSQKLHLIVRGARYYFGFYGDDLGSFYV